MGFLCLTVSVPIKRAQVVFSPPLPRSPKRKVSAQIRLRLHVYPSKKRPDQLDHDGGSVVGNHALDQRQCGLCCEEENDLAVRGLHIYWPACLCECSHGLDITPAIQVRVQLWTASEQPSRDSLDAATKVPSPPLAEPSAETLVALQRAERGTRATLPNLSLGALVGNALELPSCPVGRCDAQKPRSECFRLTRFVCLSFVQVCLERLDPSVTGIVTIVCDHTFHCECLRRWYDSLCRFRQRPQCATDADCTRLAALHSS